MPVRIASPALASAPLVACLCAAWCRSCGEYREVFAALAAEFPALQFVWVDIEDDADTLDALAALDIDNFPTLLLADGDVRFFGPLLPHAGHLRRLLVADDTGWRCETEPQAKDVAALAAQLRDWLAT